MRILSSCFLTSFLATAAVAQDQPSTILVIDGSGSMWGQIDGAAKITIAQQVVSSLLEEFPAEQGLGLTVYGHRERGNCTDIETIVAPAPGTVGDIVTAVNGIKPLGKTPMTDSVIAAAEALRYTEDTATVILISDGVETCNPDPCAAARLLEEAGIDFTAHVIGFDVDDPMALAQMQCIAEETGGQFLTASNAAELDLAMTAMVMEPEPIVVTATFEARLGDETGDLVQDPVIWDVTGKDGLRADDAEGNPLVLEMSQGVHQATAYRIVDEVEADATFTVVGDGDVTVTVVFPEVIPTAVIDAPATAVAGDTIPVTWTGPDRDGDQIIVTQTDGTRALTFSQTQEGSPLQLQMPATEGVYEIRYLMRQGTNKALASQSITVTPAQATINAPDTGLIGARIAVDWTGPDYQGDMIVIRAAGRSNVISPTPTNRGNPAEMTLPDEPGTYEISYRMQQGGTVLATELIEVSAIKASIAAPDTAFVGESITVGWEGPDYDRDYIAIGPVGDTKYDNYSYTRDGNPLALQMPTEPGRYDITYRLQDGGTILAAKQIEVTAVKATLIAPDTAIAGETITVGWDGPNYDRDYIAVGIPGEAGYINYTYTGQGNPLELQMPVDVGSYEIQYRLAQDSVVIGTTAIDIAAPELSLSAPNEAIAGDTIAITWVGPGYDGDYIAVGEVGSNTYLNYTYTDNGSPLQLQMPVTAGDYVIRYTTRQDAEVLLTRPITVTGVKADIDVPAAAKAGETLALDWSGPNYDGDYISVGPVDAINYINYTYTSEGSPLALQMPPTAGDYEVRYQLRQDGAIIFRQTIKVEHVKAQLVAPESISIGEDLIVGWDGPGYDGDYIGIAKVGEAGYEVYAYTRDGNPVTIQWPDAPGDYEIRYFIGQRATVIATRPLTVNK